MIHVALVHEPLDPAGVVARVTGATHGAIASFIGTVRNTNDGRTVLGIEYSAYLEMADAELRRIAVEARDRYAGLSVAVEHRLGTLGVGDASVVVATGHERRRQALDALGYVIEELKSRVPIWKCEHYADGTREWVNAGQVVASR